MMLLKIDASNPNIHNFASSEMKKMLLSTMKLGSVLRWLEAVILVFTNGFDDSQLKIGNRCLFATYYQRNTAYRLSTVRVNSSNLDESNALGLP